MANIAENQIYLPDDPSISLQIRLREAISKGIWDGRFAPGDRLPATRALAKQLSIARITVSLAYEELVTTGYIQSRARSGFFVSEDAPSLLKSEDFAEEPVENAVDWARRLGPPIRALGPQAKPQDWASYPYPFVFGKPDSIRFPLDDWRACARQALGKQSFQVIADDFGDRDDPMLVEQIAKRSVTGRGVTARPEEILVTSGAQNAIWFIVCLLFPQEGQGRAVIEEPGYPELRHMLIQRGIDIVPVRVDREGILVDDIPTDVDAVFVSPSHQAPTGMTMSMPRRQALLSRAEADDFVVIEDDYDFEMSYLRPHSPALKSLDRQGRVVYVGSFSKSLFPGLRLGYLVAPAAFVDRARALRTLVARHPPGLTQRAAAYFLALGYYNAHAKTLRARMAKRRAAILDAFTAGGVTVPVGNTFGGASVWIEAPDHVDTADLAERLRPQGVLIEPGAGFYHGPAPRNTMRIGFSVIPSEKIPAGVDLICRALRS
ncbi:MAG: PLP-dependent aminotransferase family protein [Pseudomonadota bacterium]